MKEVKEAPLEAWNISAKDFPSNGTALDQCKFFLGYAVLAPSSHNSQPWVFQIHENCISLYADRRRACRVVDPDDRELLISCGCALYQLRVAMRRFGRLGEVEILPERSEPDLLARVHLGAGGETSIGEGLLFFAIRKRRTNRQPFRADQVPTPLLLALRNTAEEEGAWLDFIMGEETRYAVADLVATGDRRQWASKEFRLELSKWVHSNRSGCHDGIPGYAQGMDDLMSLAGPLVVRTFDMGEGQAAKDREVATGSPMLAVLGTSGDTPRDWLNAGQALARVLLRARVEDLWASFLNQPVEIPELRFKLKDLLGRSGYPQVILRFGFGDDVKPTPRRDIEDVLIGTGSGTRAGAPANIEQVNGYANPFGAIQRNGRTATSVRRSSRSKLRFKAA